jgi:hypothetical protein
MNEIIAMTLGYMGVVVLAFVVINFLTAGFLKIFMNVKGARGKKIMTNIYALNRNYAKTGIVDNGWYVYTDANKHEKRMKIPKNSNIFYRFLNITWVNVDEEKNVFISPDGHEINGFDAEKYNNLYLRTLYRPNLMDPKTQLMFISAIVTPLLVLIVIGLLMFVVGKKVDLILANTDAIRTYFAGLNATII